MGWWSRNRIQCAAVEAGPRTGGNRMATCTCMVAHRFWNGKKFSMVRELPTGTTGSNKPSRYIRCARIKGHCAIFNVTKNISFRMCFGNLPGALQADELLQGLTRRGWQQCISRKTTTSFARTSASPTAPRVRDLQLSTGENGLCCRIWM